MNKWSLEKGVLRRQIKKRTIFCFDQLCSKSNQESEVKTEKFNKEDCQESSTDEYGKFERNGVGFMTGKGWKAFKPKKMPLFTFVCCLRFDEKYAKLTAEDGDNFVFTDECVPNAKVMVWGVMTDWGLIKLTMLPTGQTLTSEYYINQILGKEVEPLTSRRQMTGGPIEKKLLS